MIVRAQRLVRTVGHRRTRTTARAMFGFAATGDKGRSNDEWVAALKSDVPTPVRTFPRPPACVELDWTVRVEVSLTGSMFTSDSSAFPAGRS